MRRHGDGDAGGRNKCALPPVPRRAAEEQVCVVTVTLKRVPGASVRRQSRPRTGRGKSGLTMPCARPERGTIGILTG